MAVGLMNAAGHRQVAYDRDAFENWFMQEHPRLNTYIFVQHNGCEVLVRTSELIILVPGQPLVLRPKIHDIIEAIRWATTFELDSGRKHSALCRIRCDVLSDFDSEALEENAEFKLKLNYKPIGHNKWLLEVKLARG